MAAKKASSSSSSFEEQIVSRLDSFERRLRKLELAQSSNLNNSSSSSSTQYPLDASDADFDSQAKVSRSISHKHATHSLSTDSNGPAISMTQVITVLGIIGVIIALISFYAYAVMNSWIGPTGQLITGLLFGVVLGVIAFYLRESHSTWSHIVFGGAFLIEYITIAVGVHSFKILTPTLAVVLCIVLLGLSYLLILKTEMQALAYFSVVGGFFVPLISGIDSVYFSFPWYFLLSLFSLFLAYSRTYNLLRSVSFFLGTIFIFSSLSYYPRTSGLTSVEVFELVFVIAIFILYHVSCLLPGLRAEKIFVGDIVVLCFIPFLFYGQLYALLQLSNTMFGLVVMLISLVKLGEALYLKQKEVDVKYLYALLASSFITLNVGLVMLLQEFEWSVLLTFFVIQHFLFSYFSTRSDESLLFKIFSWIFLVISSVWVLIAAFIADDMLAAYVLLIGALAVGSYYMYKKEIDQRIHADIAVIYGYIFLIALTRYLDILFDLPTQGFHILFTILALLYSIMLYASVREDVEFVEIKGIAIAFLVITICKIVFVDLLFLSGIFRIVGFFIFGLLLLLGGYFLSKK
jgi:hypothetical protein